MNETKHQKKVDQYYENLSFEGGGVLGFAYVGAIKALDELGILKNIKRYSGTSVGSLFAVLLCIGFTSDEITTISYNLDLTQTKKCCLSKIFNTLNHLGLHSLRDLKRRFRTIIARKVDPEITLIDLYKKTGKDLVIVATNLNEKRGAYFHHATFPSAKLIDVLLASISVPVIFQPRKLDYMGNADYYVDGGIIDNYPIWVFNDLKKLKNGKINEIDKESPIPTTTLGLKLFRENEKNNKDVFVGRTQIRNIKSMLTEVVNTLLTQIERSEITSSYIQQTIPIHIPDISFVKFDLSRQDKEILINCGKESVQTYLQNLVFI